MRKRDSITIIHRWRQDWRSWITLAWVLCWGWAYAAMVASARGAQVIAWLNSAPTLVNRCRGHADVGQLRSLSSAIHDGQPTDRGFEIASSSMIVPSSVRRGRSDGSTWASISKV